MCFILFAISFAAFNRLYPAKKAEGSRSRARRCATQLARWKTPKAGLSHCAIRCDSISEPKYRNVDDQARPI